tara:strand:+ start:142 stop:441 length:300 start_codon:yes stop_codon:yes gene_type:complete
MIRIITLAIIYLSIISCSSFQDAGKVLRNEKIKSTDEFLVKKKDPLELPPDFDKLPKPGEATNNEKISNEKINKILKIPQDEGSNKNTSLEESILKKIK